MGLRFRRTVKIGGVRFNIGKTGVSTSIGGRGASINFGRHGIYSNAGLPGSGISYRSKIGGKTSPPNKSSYRTTKEIKEYRSVSIQFHIDDDTGETSWKDADGNPLSEDLIQIAKKQNRQKIFDLLEKECEKFNTKVGSLLELHLSTPSPDTEIYYTPIPFRKEIPWPPNESDYKTIQPENPVHKKHNLFSSRISFLRKRIENHNNQLAITYNSDMHDWQKKQNELDVKFKTAMGEYEARLSEYEKEKFDFEQEQKRLKKVVEVDRLSDFNVMQDFLEEHLNSLDWPLETIVSFEISPNGNETCIDVDLPEIEMMPSKQAKVNQRKYNLTLSDISLKQQRFNYLSHIHGIGFRLIGETFVALPSTQKIIFSGYSQRPSKKTGHFEDQYLYSVIVDRNKWEAINFQGLEHLDIVQCFELFEIRRIISKSGIIEPIEPF